jgi:transcriptional regulator with XRE-family HTH domain
VVPTLSDSQRAEFSRDLGIRLQRLRVAQGYSQEHVAHLVGVSAYTYQKLEKGESKPGTPMNPRMYTLMALAEAFGVTVGELLVEPVQ